MQMMTVELMMMIMEMMGVCYHDDGAQKHGLRKNQHGGCIHIHAHYACMKHKSFTFLHRTRGPAGPQTNNKTLKCCSDNC